MLSGNVNDNEILTNQPGAVWPCSDPGSVQVWTGGTRQSSPVRPRPLARPFEPSAVPAITAAVAAVAAANVAICL